MPQREGAGERHVLTVTPVSSRTLAAPASHWFSSHFDSRTHFPNAAWFEERAALRLHVCQARRANAAVLVLEVDPAGRLRDSLGDDILADILQRCGGHVREIMGSGVVLAALGNGLLACWIEGEAASIEALAGRLQRAWARPFNLGERPVRLALRIGAAAVLPQARADVRELLHRARVALGSARDDGLGDALRWYRPAMQNEAIDRLELEALLPQALERKQFSLAFQPQVNLATGRIQLMEALLRWQCPGKGNISPATFVPVAEDTGLIVPIGEWALREACREVGRLRRLLAGRATEVPPVAVNVSARQFMQPGLVGLIRSALDDAQLEPEHLEIEMTESVLLGDTAGVQTTLDALRAMGVRLAIDDFGTGYSSFSYLTQFSFDRLKIDRSLVVNVDQPGKGYAIVSAIVSLAHALEMLVTAEGVETAAQAEALKRLRCDDVQGYWFSRPLAPKALERALLGLADERVRVASPPPLSF
ncbi:MAG: putative signaling protein [Paracidovorax wautersii]|uniref:Putative signaling protein n=1 Tax=Paracidovorax wautersii TaxID=1177982 RepID=A0A7V8JQK1_9BURK|nr:MAG: putative signaling protein [Paracidovorax wautersii]